MNTFIVATIAFIAGAVISAVVFAALALSGRLDTDGDVYEDEPIDVWR